MKEYQHQIKNLQNSNNGFASDETCLFNFQCFGNQKIRMIRQIEHQSSNKNVTLKRTILVQHFFCKNSKKSHKFGGKDPSRRMPKNDGNSMHSKLKG
jgi:hypothetical protein